MQRHSAVATVLVSEHMDIVVCTFIDDNSVNITQIPSVAVANGLGELRSVFRVHRDGEGLRHASNRQLVVCAGRGDRDR